MKRIIWGMALCTLTVSSADAALVSRAGGQAYYDTVLGITWLADANYAKTSAYDSDGLMTLSEAQTWIGSLNTANHLGVSNWRLPVANPVNGSTYDADTFSFNGSTDNSYNISAPGSAYPGSTASELAHMYYSTLGNSGSYSISGGTTSCSAIVFSPFCLGNTGPFANLEPSHYWSSSTYGPTAFSLYFFSGYQHNDNIISSYHAWAVSPGDNLAAVPVPGALWLFGSGLAVLGAKLGRRERRRSIYPLRHRRARQIHPH